MEKNRTFTEPEVYFSRCVALPARETLLVEEEMMLYMGQSGGIVRRVNRRSPPPKPVVASFNPHSSGSPSWSMTATEENNGHIYNPPDVGNVNRITHVAGSGVMPVGNTDSTRTSVVKAMGGRSSPGASTEEDKSESWWDTFTDWLGF